MTVSELIKVVAEDQDIAICERKGYYVDAVEITSGQRTNTAYGDHQVCEVYEYDGYLMIVFDRGVDNGTY